MCFCSILSGKEPKERENGLMVRLKVPASPSFCVFSCEHLVPWKCFSVFLFCFFLCKGDTLVVPVQQHAVLSGRTGETQGGHLSAWGVSEVFVCAWRRSRAHGPASWRSWLTRPSSPSWYANVFPKKMTSRGKPVRPSPLWNSDRTTRTNALQPICHLVINSRSAGTSWSKKLLGAGVCARSVVNASLVFLLQSGAV